MKEAGLGAAGVSTISKFRWGVIQAVPRWWPVRGVNGLAQKHQHQCSAMRGAPKVGVDRVHGPTRPNGARGAMRRWRSRLNPSPGGAFIEHRRLCPAELIGRRNT
jgi:hypothetical protein